MRTAVRLSDEDLLRSEDPEAFGVFYDRHGALARTTIAVRPRAWSRPALAAAVMTAACLAAVLVAVRAIGPPAPKPAQPRIVLTIKVASVANDAVLSGGDLWVSDLNAGLARVDPATGQVKAAVPLGGASRTLASSPDGLWAIADEKGGSTIVHIDPRTGRILSRHAVAWSKWYVLAADAAGLWLPSDDPEATMERVRAPGRAPTAFLWRKDADEVAVIATPTILWAVTDRGTLVEADNVTGRLIHSFPRAVTGNHGGGASAFPEHGLAADARGDWARGPGPRGRRPVRRRAHRPADPHRRLYRRGDRALPRIAVGVRHRPAEAPLQDRAVWHPTGPRR